MSDYLVKALAYDGMARVYAAVTTETIKEAQRRHDTWSVSSAALGRTMTGTLFLGAMQKEDQKSLLKSKGTVQLVQSLLIVMHKAKSEDT